MTTAIDPPRLGAPGLFEPPIETVQSGAACTWCGAVPGEECFDKTAGPDSWVVLDDIPHAQRWRDYWNITHYPRERLDVYLAPWRQAAREEA